MAFPVRPATRAPYRRAAVRHAPRRAPLPAALGCAVFGCAVLASAPALADADPALEVPEAGRALPLSLPRDTDRDGVRDADDACPRSGRGVRVGPDGCLGFEAGADAIDFAPGSAWLGPAAERALERALRTLERFPRKRFALLARARAGADEERALAMALARTGTVMRWFAARGIDARRGDVSAIVVAGTAGATGSERRVELRLLR